MKTNYLFILFFFGIIFFSCEKEPIIYEPDEDKEKEDTTKIEPTFNSDYLFDIKYLADIRIDVQVDNWNTFLNYFDQNPDNEECVPAKFTYKKDGQTFVLDSVGLRLRGNTSRRRPEGSDGQPHNTQNPDWHHCHFVVKFGEYKKNTLFCENDRIGLKWHKDDGAYCREVYSYDLFRRFGVYTAPRVAYTKLTINVIGDAKPAYYGVYVLLEGVNDSYVENRNKSGHFVSKNGNLWKANWSANLSPSTMTDDKIGIEVVTLNPAEAYKPVYDLKSSPRRLSSKL